MVWCCSLYSSSFPGCVAALVSGGGARLLAGEPDLLAHPSPRPRPQQGGGGAQPRRQAQQRRHPSTSVMSSHGYPPLIDAYSRTAQ